MLSLVLSCIAVLGLAGLAVSILLRKRSGANIVLSVALLLLACVELSGAAGLRQYVDFETFRDASLIAEASLPASLLVLSLMFGRSRPFETHSKIRTGISAALALVPPAILLSAGTDLYYSPDFGSEDILFLAGAGYWYYLSMTVSFILSLVNVEATLAATHEHDRVRIKFQVFGVMSLLAVNIFYYSQALLYRTINMGISPARSLVFVISAGLIGYSLAFRDKGTRVSVSRQVFYRSITLLIVGVYLIGLALVGEGMRYFGVNFGRNLTIGLAFIGGLLLLAVLFSERTRRKATVYIHKHFFADKHDYREEWIRLTARLAKCASPREVCEGIVRGYLDTFGLAGASLYLGDPAGTVFTRAAGQGTPQIPANIIVSKELRTYFMVRERILEPRGGEIALAGAEEESFREAKASLVVPLISNAKLEALLILREQLVPRVMTYDDYDLMKVMARQAGQAIGNLRLSEEVSEMKAMAAVAKISSFVIHDLKNLTSGLALVTDNAKVHIGNPEFQKAAIRTVSTTVAKMQMLIQRLRSIPEKNKLITSVEDIDCLVRDIVGDFNLRKNGLPIDYTGAPVFSRIDREELVKVVVNLIQNALEAAGDQGPITVQTIRENGSACISVSDGGAGMEEDFVKNHLFRPFSTTKGKGLGIGLYQSKQIVEAHAGRIEVKSAVNKGTTFRVILPAAQAARVAV